MNKKLKIFLLALFFLVAVVLRFARLEEMAVFYYDESYDALQARKIITEKKITLLGHPYSVSGTYQGPLYYYLAAPVLWLANYNPASIAAMIAVINLLAALTIYVITKKIFGNRAALFSLMLFIVSPLIVEQARKSWYPGPIELLSPLIFYLLVNLKKNDLMRTLIAGIFTGAAMQFHILSFPLVIFGGYFCIRNKNYWGLLLFFLGVLIGFSPLIIFEFRHDFFNTHMFLKYWKSGTVFSSGDFLSEVVTFYIAFLNGIFIPRFPFNVIGVLTVLIGGVWAWKRNSKFGKEIILFVLAGSLLIPIATREVLFHYIAIFHFVPVILFGIGVDHVYRHFFYARVRRIIFAAILFTFCVVLILDGPIFKKETWGIKQSQTAGKIIAGDVRENKIEDFNVALLFHGETRAWPIRYFLDVYGVKPHGVENYGDVKYIYAATNDKKLLSIDVWELKAGGPFIIEKKWSLDSEFMLYKLNYKNL